MELISNGLYVGIGGFIGAICRFLISFFLTKLLPGNFPYGTLSANLLGCFIIGILTPLLLVKVQDEHIKLLLITGFLGALTTFSSFSYETYNLLRHGYGSQALFYIIISLSACLTLTVIGYKLSTRFFMLNT